MFDDPDRFDPARAAGAHLAFGMGAHHCLEFAGERPATVDAFPFRGPKSLPLSFAATA